MESFTFQKEKIGRERIFIEIVVSQIQNFKTWKRTKTTRQWTQTIDPN